MAWCWDGRDGPCVQLYRTQHSHGDRRGTGACGPVPASLVQEQCANHRIGRGLRRRSNCNDGARDLDGERRQVAPRAPTGAGHQAPEDRVVVRRGHLGNGVGGGCRALNDRPSATTVVAGHPLEQRPRSARLNAEGCRTPRCHRLILGLLGDARTGSGGQRAPGPYRLVFMI